MSRLAPREAPPRGLGYEAALRLPDRPALLGFAGVLLGICLYTLVISAFAQVVVSLGWQLAGRPGAFPDYLARALRFELPVGMLATNLAIGLLIGISVLMVAVVHRVRPGYLASVMPGLRWRFLIVCSALALVVLSVNLLLSTAAKGQALTWNPQPGLVGFVVVILVTTPVQAAAEEVFFRGYLMQGLGSIARPERGGVNAILASPWFAIIASAFLFACFHGLGQNLPLFLDRFGFGLLAAVLVVRTGGLEAGIAAHVLNNVMAWVLAGVTTSIAQVRALAEIGWIDAAFDVGGFAVFALAALWIGRRMELHTTTR